MIRLIFPVLSLCLSNLNAQSQIPGFFCNSGRPVTPIVGVTFNDIYNGQPFKIVISELSEKVMIEDNICFTYIKTQLEDTFIAYDIRKLIDGGLQSAPSVTVCGGPGVVTSSSRTCKYIDYTFASVDECKVDIVYRYFAYGYCRNDMYTGSNRDNEVYALTALNNTITDCCRNRILQTIADYGFGDRAYYVYPQKLPPGCVSAQLCSIPGRSLPGYTQLHY